MKVIELKNDILFQYTTQVGCKISILFRFDRWSLEISFDAIIGSFLSPGKCLRWRFSHPGSRSGVDNWHFHKNARKILPTSYIFTLASANRRIGNIKGPKGCFKLWYLWQLCVFFFTFFNVSFRHGLKLNVANSRRLNVKDPFSTLMEIY